MNTTTEPERDVVVLTGTIGSGKTAVGKILSALGANVVHADTLAHEVIAKGSPGYDEVVSRFGAAVLLPNGEIDRKALGRIVFDDVQERKALERIVHPRVRRLSEDRFRQGLKSGAPLVVYECPLFFESGLDSQPFRAVVTVVADEPLCIERICKRDSLTQAEATARLRQQLSAAEKSKRSSFVIENNGTEQELETEVRKLWPRLIAPETRPRR
ncbi:MAG: dephospho-CoA kinase [Bdellovibrionota bacterium]